MPSYEAYCQECGTNFKSVYWLKCQDCGSALVDKKGERLDSDNHIELRKLEAEKSDLERQVKQANSNTKAILGYLVIFVILVAGASYGFI